MHWVFCCGRPWAHERLIPSSISPLHPISIKDSIGTVLVLGARLVSPQIREMAPSILFPSPNPPSIHLHTANSKGYTHPKSPQLCLPHEARGNLLLCSWPSRSSCHPVLRVASCSVLFSQAHTFTYCYRQHLCSWNPGLCMGHSPSADFSICLCWFISFLSSFVDKNYPLAPHATPEPSLDVFLNELVYKWKNFRPTMLNYKKRFTTFDFSGIALFWLQDLRKNECIYSQNHVRTNIFQVLWETLVLPWWWTNIHRRQK